jgi:hypothetical protein
MQRFALAVCLTLCLAAGAFAQGFSRSDPPDWVDIAALPAVDPDLFALAQGGVYYLLGDRQIRWDGDLEYDYYRNVFQVIDRAGLDEAATIQFTHNPASEEAILTRLQIRRGDQVIDLRDSLPFETYRRETRLEEGIIDGSLTTVLQVPDLRVGDILDTAWILRGQTAVPGAPRGDTGRMEFGEPVSRERMAVHWPENVPVYLGDLPPGSGVTYTTRPGRPGEVVHEWEAVDLPPVTLEENTPLGIDIRAKVRFSSAADWGPVSAALSPYYLADYPLPPEWAAKVDAIAAEYPTAATRATAALRMVQDDLRYVSLSVGAGGYFARLPQDVITSGFGDCKDKALLLRLMLQRLGIEAYVALADIDEGYGLALEEPLLGAFDHAIVMARIAGKPVWMDATATHEGGVVDTAAAPDYGFALPLTGAGQTRLEPIAIDPATHWQVEVEEDYNFTLLGVYLKVASVYRGAAANDRRRDFAVTPLASKSADYLRYYSDRYPGLKVLAPLKLEDDRQANQLVVRESYFLATPALYRNGLREDFSFAAENFADNLPDVDTGLRKAPLYTGGASSHKHVITVQGAPINFDPPEAKRIVNDAFDFAYDGSALADGAMTMTWVYQRKGPVVQASKAAEVIRDAREVGDMVWWTWSLVP